MSNIWVIICKIEMSRPYKQGDARSEVRAKADLTPVRPLLCTAVRFVVQFTLVFQANELIQGRTVNFN